MSAHDVYNGLKVTSPDWITKSASSLAYQIDALCDEIRSGRADDDPSPLDDWTSRCDDIVREMESMSKDECEEVISMSSQMMGYVRPGSRRAMIDGAERIIRDDIRSAARGRALRNTNP